MHRIGRTGRAGRSGRATAFFVPGYEPKVGNQVLYGDIKRLFEESQQPLPDWFLHGMSGAAAGGGGGAFGGGGGRSGGYLISVARRWLLVDLLPHESCVLGAGSRLSMLPAGEGCCSRVS